MHRTLFMEVLHSIRYSLLLPYWLCYCSVTSVVSDSVRPQRWQPTRLRRPWDSPGKNTGVGCHFLLQCMKVKSESEVTQLCPTLRDPMDYSLPGSSVHGAFHARVLEQVAIAFSIHFRITAKVKMRTFKKFYMQRRKTNIIKNLV